MTPGEIHNRDVGRIIRAIVMPTLHAGGEFTDVLALLESIVAGVLLYGVKSGGDEVVLDVFANGVRERLEKLRETDTELGEPDENKPIRRLDA